MRFELYLAYMKPQLLILTPSSESCEEAIGDFECYGYSARRRRQHSSRATALLRGCAASLSNQLDPQRVRDNLVKVRRTTPLYSTLSQKQASG